MKTTTQGFRAHEYEAIQATSFAAPFVSRVLYAVEGQAGVWRRVKIPAKGQPAVEGMIKVFAGDSVIGVVKDPKAMSELNMGGYRFTSWKGDGKQPEIDDVIVFRDCSDDIEATMMLEAAGDAAAKLAKVDGATSPCGILTPVEFKESEAIPIEHEGDADLPDPPEPADVPDSPE